MSDGCGWEVLLDGIMSIWKVLWIHKNWHDVGKCV
jgi:hypothetical protein